MTSVHQGEISYKSLIEANKILCNDDEKLESKASCLVLAWREIRMCVLKSSKNDAIDLLNWAKRHTLNVVLSGKWGKHKGDHQEKLLYELYECEKLNGSYAVHCRKLIKLILDPWGHPTLQQLLYDENLKIGAAEFDFFTGESCYLISFRLKVLCENRCEDLALNLVTAYKSCREYAKKMKHSMNLTEDQERFMLDVHISLLYKYRHISVIVSTLKVLPLSEALQFIKRFVAKKVEVSKLWEYSIRITHFAAVLFCSRAVMEYSEEKEDFLKSLLAVWFPLHQSEKSLQELIASLRRVMQLAISSIYMYMFCEGLTTFFGANMKSFIIELYIQALTTDLNELERQRNDENKENEIKTLGRLASGFVKLADMLQDHLSVASECLLTSYSLKPSEETLKKIEDVAKAKGYNVFSSEQWKCKLHPPICQEDDVCVQCDVCGDFMGQLELSTALNTNFMLNDALRSEQLGLSSQLCDDLAVLVCSPRYQFLSWKQDWRDLHRLCALYLHNPEKTKNFVKDLKFVDVDYSIFITVKNEPLETDDNYIAITNCEELMAEEFKTDKYLNDVQNDENKSGTAINEYIDVFLPPKTNSDPKVLKSLRSFRKALKRANSDEIEASSSNLQLNKPALETPAHSCADTKTYKDPDRCKTIFETLEELAKGKKIGDDDFRPKRVYKITLPKKPQHLNENSAATVKKTREFTRSSDFSKQYGDNSRSESTRTLGNDGFMFSNRSEKSDSLMSKAMVEPTERVSCTEEKVPPWKDGSDNFQQKSEPLVGVKTSNEIFKDENMISNEMNEHSSNLSDQIAILLDDEQNVSIDSIPSDMENELLDDSDTTITSTQINDDCNTNMTPNVEHTNDIETIHSNEDQKSDNDVNLENVTKVSDTDHFVQVAVETIIPNSNVGEMEASPDGGKPETTTQEPCENKVVSNSQSFESKNSLITGSYTSDDRNSIPSSDVGLEVYRSLFQGDSYIKGIRGDTSSTSGTFQIANSKEIEDLNVVSCNNNSESNSYSDSETSETLNEMSPDARSDIAVERLRERFESLAIKKSWKKIRYINWGSKANKTRPTKKTKNIRGFVTPTLSTEIKKTKNILRATKMKFTQKDAQTAINNATEKPTGKLDNLQLLKEIYKLKDVRVVLKRLDFNQYMQSRPTVSKRNENTKRRKGRRRKQSRNVQDSMEKSKYKSSPLQDANPRVELPKLIETAADCPKKSVEDGTKLIPRVILNRVDMENVEYSAKCLLNNIPGLHDTEMIRPSTVDNVVQVVQVAGGRSNSSVQGPNNQTSTQVTPHIQRIGQPRIEKPESNSESPTTVTKSSTTPTGTKPSSTQPSTLINILSQQIIRPGQSANNRPPRPPYINILSQQIIRPANCAVSSKQQVNTATTTDSAQVQNTSARIVTAGEHPILNQLVSPVRSSQGTIKAVVGPSVTDQNRIVQFICKSTDGKLIPVTSIATSRVVKVATTQTVMSSSPVSPNLDDSYTKLVNTSPKSKNDSGSENSESLPKFQQAFGKTVYQSNSVESPPSSNLSNNSGTTDLEKSKLNIKNSTTLNVQPIQGGVIYTRQMPVGQAINLIPQSRVFRIATSNSEQISIAKDTVIQNKMNALLAAALQGKQKNSETSDNDTNADANSVPANARIAVAARSALVQNTRIVKPVLQVPTNVIRNTQTGLSSTTLEQLREFDMVYKQVKERSSTTIANESSVLPENSDNPQRISVTYLNQGQKLNCAPVVVVSSYNNLQPAASPALSVASQGSSSPCVTPAPTPTPVLPKVASKSSKGKSVKNATLHATKASPIPKPQQKPQEDEHTTQRIFDILAEYAEQLRNSPDLNNKPAPRRRSNPPTNPNQNSKRKKNSGTKKSGQCPNSATSDIDTEDPRTLGSEDSSCGVVQISMQEDEQTSVTTNTPDTNDSSVQPPRQQLILTESSNNPTRNLIIADTSSVGEALKMPNTAVLVPGNYIMPVSMVKGGQQIAVVSGGSKILATVPARSGPNMLLFQSFLNQNRKSNVSTVKYSAIQPLSGISSQPISGTTTQSPVILPSAPLGTVSLGQPLTIKKVEDSERVNAELLLISHPQETNVTAEDSQQPDSSTSVMQNNVDLEENATLSDNSSDKQYSFQKRLVSTPIATPVIACNKDSSIEEQTATPQTIMSINLNSIEQNKGDSVKVEERVQSVLVAAGTSNGPMLSHSPPHYNKQSECSESTTDQYKDDFLHNGGKATNNEQKIVQPNNIAYNLQGKAKKAQVANQKDREQLQHQQAALERELRLQKSLSEECEDLGVDEPSTSDLFPEADLLFDSNHSPSFDQSSQDNSKRHVQDTKEESKLILFSDDDFLFESNDYQSAELEYEERPHMLTNGQNNSHNETMSADNTLLRTCTSMSDVTLNSPISPNSFNSRTPPPSHKYIHKYSNRKKTKQSEQWTPDVLSSEDTTGSTDMSTKRNDESLEGSNFKTGQSVTKLQCETVNCNDTDCGLSGRGARKAVKKTCPCCNGLEDTTSRKRGSTQNPIHPNKKVFNKKR